MGSGKKRFKFREDPRAEQSGELEPSWSGGYDEAQDSIQSKIYPWVITRNHPKKECWSPAFRQANLILPWLNFHVVLR